MASTTTCTSSVLHLLVLAAFASSASASTFIIKNNCGYTVYPRGIPVDGGTQLNPGQTRTINVPRGTNGKFWGLKDQFPSCTFNVTTGRYDCPGQTTAEYTIAGTGSRQDFYDISVVGGYNLPMAFSCSTGVGLVCNSPNCPDAYQNPKDDTKTHACSANSNYKITFCV